MIILSLITGVSSVIYKNFFYSRRPIKADCKFSDWFSSNSQSAITWHEIAYKNTSYKEAYPFDTNPNNYIVEHTNSLN